MFDFFVSVLVYLNIIVSPAPYTDPELTAIINANQQPITQHVQTTGEGEHFV